MDPFRIGLIGCGTVGGGVLELTHRRAEELRRIVDRPIEVVRIAVRDPRRPRQHAHAFVDREVFTGRTEEVTDDPSIDCVVEVAGGVDAPRDWLIRALRQGKDIVTANKAALAFHGEEIFGVARECRRNVFYEASVAAAMPVIETIQNGLVANHVRRLSAILNGTCNYILTRMERDHMDYEPALRLAQQKGFAEADPTLDVNGEDSAHKLTLLARLLARSHVPLERVYTEGIEHITREDIDFAAELGYRIKLLAIARETESGAWDLRVHPTLLDQRGILAQVMEEYNAAYIRADAAGPMLIYGNGAGSLPTASSVVADIVRSAKGDRAPNPAGGGKARCLPTHDVLLRHYIRLRVRDTPGILGRITSHFGSREISISSLRQPDAKEGQAVPVVLVTHRARDRVVSETLETLEELGLLAGPWTRIRIED